MEDIHVRQALPEDISDIVELENKIWPEGTRAPQEKFEKRLAVFSQGFLLALKGSELIGASTSEIISYFKGDSIKSWEHITDNGYIKETHNPKGNALYIVSLGALSRSGGGSALLSRQKETARKLGLSILVLGARVPGYDNYCKKIREIHINEYILLKRADGSPYDDELRFYIRNGLKIDKIMPNYMEDDSESRNYGAVMTFVLK